MQCLKTARLFIGVCATLGGCYAWDEYVMHNPQTGEDIVCAGGKYYFEEGAPEMELAGACIRACAKQGFELTKGPRYDKPRGSPPKDLASAVPLRCRT